MIHLMVSPIEQGEDVPAGAEDFLMTYLGNAVTSSGVTADANFGQFFITGKFNHITQDVVAGPPIQTALHTVLTLYIGDINTQKIFSQSSFELRGVGRSDQKAFINALKSLNKNNSSFEKFVNSGKDKIISYFNSNYPSILAQAKTAASRNNLEEALYYASSIPECCSGYSEASGLITKYYQDYIDREGKILLNKAKSIWASGADKDAAVEAISYLMSIDPSSVVGPQAESLLSEIKKSVKDDRMFEERTKYKDRVETERQRIAAARAVGVAWGNGQKARSSHIYWIR